MCGRKGHFANKCPLNRVSVLEESGTTAGRTGLSVHFPTTGPGLATAGILEKTLAGIGGPLLTLVGVNGLKIPGRPHRKLFQLQRKRPLRTLLCLKRPQFRL